MEAPESPPIVEASRCRRPRSAKGFDYENTTYRSVSAVAKKVTGAHWNGYLAFGIERPTSERRTAHP
jgi:hypothetical protein